uniref:Uncharacterized protein n=1 Tax=Brassica oleracea var. oleracea TaxID=109376 RepID=A0A0D3CFV6_BRAOL
MKKAYTNKKTGQIDDGLVREVVTLVQIQVQDEVSQLQTEDDDSTASTNFYPGFESTKSLNPRFQRRRDVWSVWVVAPCRFFLLLHRRPLLIQKYLRLKEAEPANDGDDAEDVPEREIPDENSEEHFVGTSEDWTIGKSIEISRGSSPSVYSEELSNELVVLGVSSEIRFLGIPSEISEGFPRKNEFPRSYFRGLVSSGWEADVLTPPCSPALKQLDKENNQNQKRYQGLDIRLRT